MIAAVIRLVSNKHADSDIVASVRREVCLTLAVLADRMCSL